MCLIIIHLNHQKETISSLVFFVDNTDDISSFNELTDAQKRHYTDKLKHWLKTNNIDCDDEPKMYLISNVD